MVVPRRRILCVASGGGHWIELMRLLPALDGHDVAFVSVDKMYSADVVPDRFYKVRDVTRWDRWRVFETILKMIWILWIERPGIVISTGALPGYIGLRIAKWFNAKTIWVDSIANVEELSMSGRRAGKFADLWLTQWPHLAKVDGPHYSGTVL